MRKLTPKKGTEKSVSQLLSEGMESMSEQKFELALFNITCYKEFDLFLEKLGLIKTDNEAVETLNWQYTEEDHKHSANEIQEVLRGDDFVKLKILQNIEINGVKFPCITFKEPTTQGLVVRKENAFLFNFMYSKKYSKLSNQKVLFCQSLLKHFQVIAATNQSDIHNFSKRCHSDLHKFLKEMFKPGISSADFLKRYIVASFVVLTSKKALRPDLSSFDEKKDRVISWSDYKQMVQHCIENVKEVDTKINGWGTQVHYTYSWDKFIEIFNGFISGIIYAEYSVYYPQDCSTTLVEKNGVTKEFGVVDEEK